MTERRICPECGGRKDPSSKRCIACLTTARKERAERTSKTCGACGIDKPLEAFSPVKGRLDGRYSRCKECVAEAAREKRKLHPEKSKAADTRYRKKHPDRVRAKKRRQYQADPERYREQKRKSYRLHRETRTEDYYRRRRQNPEAAKMVSRAHGAVRNAIKNGTLTRPDTCSFCGTSGVAIEAAHHDYLKPLDVKWLCRPCHRKWDLEDPKAKPSLDRLTVLKKRNGKVG